MGALYDEISKEDGLLVKLRCDNNFDDGDFQNIKKALLNAIPVWKETGQVKVNDFVVMLELIQTLAGESRFWSDEVQIAVEDAELEIMDIVHDALC
ncbi:MAG: hypothetical protein IKO10_01055 [Lachnospiraceae bacterium]|nr:hypothetical protein [Lachnospiraceae bacterium]